MKQAGEGVIDISSGSDSKSDSDSDDSECVWPSPTISTFI